MFSAQSIQHTLSFMDHIDPDPVSWNSGHKNQQNQLLKSQKKQEKVMADLLVELVVLLHLVKKTKRKWIQKQQVTMMRNRINK